MPPCVVLLSPCTAHPSHFTSLWQAEHSRASRSSCVRAEKFLAGGPKKQDSSPILVNCIAQIPGHPGLVTRRSYRVVCKAMSMRPTEVLPSGQLQ